VNATERSHELRALAQRIADALPSDVVEAAVTGSVSRGMADEVSDIEMLVVTRKQIELDEAMELAGVAGLDQLDTWSQQDVPTKRVSGLLEGVPIELVWWAQEYAEEQVDAIFEGEAAGSADALFHAVP